MQTIYPAPFVNETSIFDFSLRPGPSQWPRPDCPTAIWSVDPSKCVRSVNPGRTYRFYTGNPVLPFGFGLSYTTWEYEVAAAPASISVEPLLPLLKQANAIGGFMPALLSGGGEDPSAGPTVVAATFSLAVTNTGSTESDHVVLACVSGDLHTSSFIPPLSFVRKMTAVFRLAAGAV